MALASHTPHPNRHMLCSCQFQAVSEYPQRHKPFFHSPEILFQSPPLLEKRLYVVIIPPQSLSVHDAVFCFASLHKSVFLPIIEDLLWNPFSGQTNTDRQCMVHFLHTVLIQRTDITIQPLFIYRAQLLQQHDRWFL